VNVTYQGEQTCFRVVLLRRNAEEILVSPEADRFVLPTVQIPKYTRHAQQITSALASVDNLQSYCLFTVPADSEPGAGPHYAFVCAADEDASPPKGFRWVTTNLSFSGSSLDRQDFIACQSGFEVIHRCQRDPASGYFGRPGWLREIMIWSQQQLDPREHCLTEEYCQLNASPTSCLLRLRTVRSAVWFKAVGGTNQREFPITVCLYRHFPRYLPTMIAKRDDCNAWLAEESAGSHPDGNLRDEAWIAVAGSLAELQLASMGRVLHLTAAGCRDVRPQWLVQTVRPFLEAMARLMAEQTGTSPAPLTRSELKTVENILFDAISSIEKLDVPATLGHLDFNPGNIIVRPDRIVFLDWAAACVGSPFLTFEYLLERLRRLRADDQWLRTQVFSAYVERWRLVHPDHLAPALAAAPLLAVFVYAAASDAWRHPIRLRDPVTRGHLRSLTRRIKREAERWVSNAVSGSISLQTR
jgi:hypothetical protein